MTLKGKIEMTLAIMFSQAMMVVFFSISRVLKYDCTEPPMIGGSGASELELTLREAEPRSRENTPMVPFWSLFGDKESLYAVLYD
jgi:hypothetical protein